MRCHDATQPYHGITPCSTVIYACRGSGGPVFTQFTLPHRTRSRPWPEQWEEWAKRTGDEIFHDPDYLEGFGSLQTITHWIGMYAAFDKEKGIGCVVPSGVIIDFLQTDALMPDEGAGDA